MALTVEEWNAVVQEALNKPEDSATVISSLTRARDEYATLFGENVAALDRATKAEAENERLRQTNMDLFLRIGQQTAASTGSMPGEDSAKERADTIKIEDLFKKEDK